MTKGNLEKLQIDLIEESFRVFQKFNHIKKLYKENLLSFNVIEDFVDDRGKSCLFRLKEMCHNIYRNSDIASYKEKLYDITVGYTFHEAMKLRESIYELEYYKPKAQMVKGEVGEKEIKIVREIEYFVKKTEKRFKEGFLQLRRLVKELSYQLKDLILLYRNNYLLPRFLLENRKLLISTYGRRGFREILSNLFQDGKDKLFYFAGLSYLSSDFYDEARLAFKRALDTEGGNKEALYFYYYASAFSFFYKGKLMNSMTYIQEAKELGKSLNIPDQFIQKLDGLFSELKKEKRITRKNA
jgi:hypothetical protein